MHDMDHLINALKEHCTVAVNMTGSLFFNSLGTTCKDTLIATCPVTSTKPSQSTNTPNRSLPDMHHTKQHQSNSVQNFRGWRLTPHNHSPQKKLNAFKTSSVPSCTMRKQLIQHLLLHLAQLQHNKPRAHGQWQMLVTNTPQLRCHSLKCWHLIHSMQFGTFSTHRRLLPFQTWW